MSFMFLVHVYIACRYNICVALKQIESLFVVIPGHCINLEPSCLSVNMVRNQFGIHQELPGEDDENYEDTKEVIEDMIEYMQKIWEPKKDNNRIK